MAEPSELWECERRIVAYLAAHNIVNEGGPPAALTRPALATLIGKRRERPTISAGPRDADDFEHGAIAGCLKRQRTDDAASCDTTDGDTAEGKSELRRNFLSGFGTKTGIGSSLLQRRRMLSMQISVN